MSFRPIFPKIIGFIFAILDSLAAALLAVSIYSNKFPCFISGLTFSRFLATSEKIPISLIPIFVLFIEFLLNCGADVNICDEFEKNIVHKEILKGYSNYKMIDFLVSHGANIDARDFDEKSVMGVPLSFFN